MHFKKWSVFLAHSVYIYIKNSPADKGTGPRPHESAGFVSHLIMYSQLVLKRVKEMVRAVDLHFHQRKLRPVLS